MRPSGGRVLRAGACRRPPEWVKLHVLLLSSLHLSSFFVSHVLSSPLHCFPASLLLSCCLLLSTAWRLALKGSGYVCWKARLCLGPKNESQEEKGEKDQRQTTEKARTTSSDGGRKRTNEPWHESGFTIPLCPFRSHSSLMIFTKILKEAPL